MPELRTDPPDLCRRELLDRICEGAAPRETVVETTLDRLDRHEVARAATSREVAR
ncbi:MAG: hypothetical protein AAF390_17155 [Pseudomonadota bacterium]